MARVFLVQNPSRRDPFSGEWVPKFDLSPAARIGDVIEMIPPGPDYDDPAELTTRLRRHLMGVNGYRAGDYLLALGDPVAIGISMTLAMLSAGEVTVLKYDRQDRMYYPRRCVLPALGATVS